MGLSFISICSNRRLERWGEGEREGVRGGGRGREKEREKREGFGKVCRLRGLGNKMSSVYCLDELI